MQVRLTHGECGAFPLSRDNRHRRATLVLPPAPPERFNPWLPALQSPPCARQRSSPDGRRSRAKASRSGSQLAAARSVAAAVAVPESPAAQVPISAAESKAIAAGPTTPKPSYDAIDSQPQNRLFMHLFRGKLAEGLGEDAPEPGFDGIITLTRLLNKRYRPEETQRVTHGILKSLLPPGLPAAFKVLFAGPLPVFSQRLNAAVTARTCQWLMGPSVVNDIQLDSGEILQRQGVLVERCRVLEESGCASVCINSCKVPTQTFFQEDMGLKLRMTPNYEDFSCQFSFGVAPLPESEDEAFTTPCFMQCPTKRRHQEAVTVSQCHNVVPVPPVESAAE